MTHAVTVSIKASPEAVYALVSDVTRMGEWSPECVRCEWQDTTTFKGWNKRGVLKWSTTAKVKTAEPGKEFSFATQSGGKDSTLWRYEFAATADGCDVTESYEELYAPKLLAWLEGLVMKNRSTELEAGMRTTLERIKAVAER